MNKSTTPKLNFDDRLELCQGRIQYIAFEYKT